MDIRQWITLVESSTMALMFHRTTSNRLAAIRQDGLKIDSDLNLTEGGTWAHEVYGRNPIYVSSSPDTMYAEHAPIVLSIDVTGLKLVADLPSLVNHGAYYDVDEWIMWWEKGQRIRGMPIEVSFDTLLDPASKATIAAIKATGTAACLTDISPERIKVLP